MQTQLINLITNEPPLLKNYAQVKFRKNFTNLWYDSIENFDNYKDNILEVLVNFPPVLQYGQLFYHIPIYLPIKKEYLQNKRIHSDNMYMDVNPSYGDKREVVRQNMFIVFLDYLTKNNINYLAQDKENNTLLNQLIVRLMKWNEKKFASLVMPNGLLYEKLNNLSPEENYNMWSLIKNNWAEIWTNYLPNLRSHFIYSKYCDPHMIFEVLNTITSKIDSKTIPDGFIDEKLQKIIIDLQEFVPYHPSLKETVISLQYLCLCDKTKQFQYDHIKKIHKI